MGLEELVRILKDGDHSLVVGNGDEVRCYDGRGVSDLWHLLKDSPEMLDGASVADKVIGKGAAALMILGKVKRVHALTLSEPALSLFRGSGVDVTYDKLVANIINRKGDDICPVEKLCTPCATAGECLPLIDRFVKSLNK